MDNNEIKEMQEEIDSFAFSRAKILQDAHQEFIKTCEQKQKLLDTAISSLNPVGREGLINDRLIKQLAIIQSNVQSYIQSKTQEIPIDTAVKNLQSTLRLLSKYESIPSR